MKTSVTSMILHDQNVCRLTIDISREERIDLYEKIGMDPKFYLTIFPGSIRHDTDCTELTHFISSELGHTLALVIALECLDLERRKQQENV